MNTKVLRLNKAGTPIAWLSWQETATLLVKDQVLWSIGDSSHRVRGGYNKAGVRSELALPSIIACDGRVDGGGGRGERVDRAWSFCCKPAHTEGPMK